VLTASFTLPLIQNTDACPAGAAINEWYKAEGASRMLEAEEAYEMAVADYDVSDAACGLYDPLRRLICAVYENYAYLLG